jgi:hypothetical protein
MANVKNYFHDRMVLLLLSVNAFLALLSILSVLLRLQGGGEGFIVQYRENVGVSNAFKPGEIGQLLLFIVFAILVFGVHGLLSHRVYHIRRQLSLFVLALGALLLGLSIIVANALLALH